MLIAPPLELPNNAEVNRCKYYNKKNIKVKNASMRCILTGILFYVILGLVRGVKRVAHRITYQLPCAMAVQEKRQYPRIFYNTPLHCKIRGQTKYADTAIDDISLGGLSFTYDSFIPPHTYLMLEFCVRKNMLSPIGRIVWTNSMPYAHKYRCGVEFSEINQESRHYLKDLFTLEQSA